MDGNLSYDYRLDNDDTASSVGIVGTNSRAPSTTGSSRPVSRGQQSVSSRNRNNNNRRTIISQFDQDYWDRFVLCLAPTDLYARFRWFTPKSATMKLSQTLSVHNRVLKYILCGVNLVKNKFINV